MKSSIVHRRGSTWTPCRVMKTISSEDNSEVHGLRYPPHIGHERQKSVDMYKVKLNYFAYQYELPDKAAVYRIRYSSLYNSIRQHTPVLWIRTMERIRLLVCIQPRTLLVTGDFCYRIIELFNYNRI